MNTGNFFFPGSGLLNKTQLKEVLMGVLERVESGKINEGYIFAFFDEHNQEELLPIQKQSKLTWKALAEAHLRERVRNPHDYRSLSIELYAMEKAGYDWRRDFSSYGELSRFLEQLYNTKLRTTKLTERINDLDLLRKKYEIEEAVSNWGNMTPNFDPN